MNQERKIVWEKYRDSWEELFELSEDAFDLSGHGNPEEDEELLTKPMGKITLIPQVSFNSAYGNVPITKTNLPSNTYELWWMHTNFNLSRDIVDQIATFPGVELCKIVSRYRILVGFGKAFLVQAGDNPTGIDADKGPEYAARMKLQRFLINPVYVPLDAGILLAGELDRNHLYWGLLILPNNSIEIIHSEEYNNEFKLKLNTYKSLAGKVNGNFLCSYLCQDS